MCMMLIQCFGCANLGKRRAALNGHIPVPFDAQLALVVAYVALALDVRGFGRGAVQIAQLVEPCDTLLAVLVDHVALSLDVRGFVQMETCDRPCECVTDINVSHCTCLSNSPK